MEQLKIKLRDQFWKMWIVTHEPLLLGLGICKVVWGFNQSQLELGFPAGRTVQTPTATVLLKVMQSISIELPFENSQIPEITIIFHFHFFERFKSSEEWSARACKFLDHVHKAAEMLSCELGITGLWDNPAKDERTWRCLGAAWPHQDFQNTARNKSSSDV